MRNYSILPVSLFLLVSCGAEIDSENEIQLPQASAANIESHISFLADDLLQGRDTGTEGFEIAARYVAAEFTSLGVAPAGNNGSYFQEITFREAYRDLEAASMVVHTPQGDETFLFRDEFITAAPMVRLQEEVTAPLVFVGFGIESDWLNHHDYEGLDVSGKIVVTLAGRPESFPSEEGAHFSSLKNRIAASRGAVGMITLRTPTVESVSPFARGLRNLHRPAVRYLDIDGSPADTIVEFRGGASLSLDASARLFDLAGYSLDEVFNTIEQGEVPKGFELPLSVTLARASRHETITSPNIIGLIEGSDPVLKNEYVAFTAHLDHVGPAENDDDDIIHNGALDNAAGVAALLENARLLMALPERPRRSILFVIVTAEEKGLLGAKYYAENATVPIHNIVANVNLDMPMILYPFNNVIAFGAQHSSLRESTQSALQALDLELMDDPMPEEGLFVRSDHYEFVKQGIPAVFLSVGFGSDDPELNGEEIFNNFLQNHYHQVSDSTDLPIDYDAGALFAQVNFMIGLEVANADQRPTWNENNFFGTEFGREWSR